MRAAGTITPGALAWLGGACLACLSAALINGGLFFHYDTVAYLQIGEEMLSVLRPAPDLADTTAAAAPEAASGAGGGSKTATRSPVFALLARLLAAGQALWAMPLLHMALMLGLSGLIARVGLRAGQQGQGGGAIYTALPVMVAGLGALPFFVAFLMPDLYAAFLILIIALISAFIGSMTRGEILTAFALGGLAVMVHPSHFGIALLMLPLVAVAGLLAKRRRWMAPAFLAAILGLELAQQTAFRTAVKSQTGQEVVHMPLITARLVADGPGLRYLADHCPDPAIATCRLYHALSLSDDPMRLTASHILFRHDLPLASYRLLPAAEQTSIAVEQFGFFFKVLRNYPAATTWALLRNTLVQSVRYNVAMTLQNPQATDALAGGNFTPGRLASAQGWLAPLTVAQTALYALSLTALAGLVLWPGALSAQIRVFCIMIVLGILVNAFVCGGFSQPATRYGARVVWLLPYTATLAFLFSPFFQARISRNRRTEHKTTGTRA